MYKVFSIFIFSILSGCAHNSPYAPIKKEYQDNNISVNAVRSLARSSYLKGCTENSKKKFEKCIEMAKKHQEEITEILLKK